MNKSNNTLSLTTFDKKDVKINQFRELYNGFFKINQYKLRIKQFQGGFSEEFTREIFERGDGVAILLFDPILDNVILIEQFRAGVLARDENPWVLELVAGMADKEEEDFVNVAIRETREEAGLEILNIKPINNFFVSSGGTSEKIYLYVGQVDSSNAGGIFGLNEENEDIKVHVIKRERVNQLVKNNTINNATAIIAIQWLNLNLDELLFEWSEKN